MVSVPPIQGAIDALVTACNNQLAVPVRGVTTDGRVVAGLFGARRASIDTSRLRDAALAFLAALDPADRDRATFPLDSTEWRSWFNVHMNFFRHGVMLEDLNDVQRELGLDLARSTLSERGYAQFRDGIGHHIAEHLRRLASAGDENAHVVRRRLI